MICIMKKGIQTFVYTPVGFVSDHLEVLYDNDYECKVVCDEVGASYYRPAMPNIDPLFVDAMVDAVFEKLEEAEIIVKESDDGHERTK